MRLPAEKMDMAAIISTERQSLPGSCVKNPLRSLRAFGRLRHKVQHAQLSEIKK